MPTSVQAMRGPFEKSFAKPGPSPWPFPGITDSLHSSLHDELEELPPFFRDAKVVLRLRTFYFNRTNPNGTINEAWAAGGSVVYQSGWYQEFFSIGAEIFNAQKLYAPGDRGGTRVLRSGQQDYTVLGRLYGHLKYQTHEVMLYRQYLDLPYLNRQDNRLTPNTFEGYRLFGQLAQFHYLIGYIDKMKRRGASTFISMSQAAGASARRKRGLVLLGFGYLPPNAVQMGVTNYLIPDAMNILYAETTYTWMATPSLGIRAAAQFSDQRSVGKALLPGPSFAAQTGSTEAILSYHNAAVMVGFSRTASTGAIHSPFGTAPGYLTQIARDFNRAGEVAWKIGLAYDFAGSDFPGLSLLLSYTYGWNAHDAVRKKALPDEAEWDVTVDYRIQQGFLRGVWFRIRNGFVDFKGQGRPLNDLRISINYELPVL